MSDFSLYDRKVRLHFCSFVSLRNGSNHSPEEDGENCFCSKEYLKWLCNMKIKGRNSGRNQQKLFSTGSQTLFHRLRHCGDT